MHKPGGGESNAEDRRECPRGTGCKSPAERSTTQPYGKRAAPTSLRPGLEPCQHVYTCRRTPGAPTAQTCHRVLGSCRVGRERPSLPLAFSGPSPFRASSALGHRPTRSVLGSALGGKQPCAECQLLRFVVKISTPPDKSGQGRPGLGHMPQKWRSNIRGQQAARPDSLLGTSSLGPQKP